MQSLFGFDLPTAQKWVIAFGVILVLLVLLGLFARQIKDGRLRIKGQGGGRTRQPRLGVVDIHDLDRQRQLVLIRRDNVEHLVMIGGASDVVVETNIVRSGGRAALPTQADAVPSDRPLPFDTLVPPELLRQDMPRQETARQETARQDAVRQDSLDELRRATAPAAPVAAAPSIDSPARAVPRTSQAASAMEAAVAAAAGGAALLGTAAVSKELAATPVSPAPSVQPPNFARDHAPAPTASTLELDDMARQLDEALKRPLSAVRPAQGGSFAPAPTPAATPALTEPVKPAEPAKAVEPFKPAEPPKASEPSKPVEALKTAEPATPVETAAPVEADDVIEPAVEPPAPPPPAVPVPPPVSVTPPAPVSARVVPLDVEAELEMALGLKPERTGPRSAPAVAPPPFFPSPAASTVSFSPPPAVAKPEERAPEPEPEPKPASSEPAADKPIVETVEADAPAAAADKPAEPAAPKTIDPFSVDAIEAEFARLLGRDPKTKG